MEEALSLVDVLVLERALELELLKAEHLGDHGKDVEDVDHYQNDEKNGEDNIESLSENGYDVCFSHNLRKGCFSIIDYLKEIIAERRGNSGAISS